MFANGKEIVKFKANNKNFNFPTLCSILFNFCLGTIPNRASASESMEVSLKGNVYDFSFDYDAIDKSDVLNIHNHLTVKNNTKYSSELLSKCLLDN